jgi:hypothetical protein
MGRRIAGYRLDKAGKLVKCSAHQDVVARFARAGIQEGQSGTRC